MNLKKNALALLACLPVLSSQAQYRAPENWFTLDYSKDKTMGVSADAALSDLKAKGKKGKPVIVAVLDSGVEPDHEDLKDVMWVNPGEIPGNGIDDDKNGYVDDIHGWNFLGGKDGRNVEHDSYELTREYVRLSKKYASGPGSDKKEYAYFLNIKAAFEEKRGESESEKEAVMAQLRKIEAYFKTAEGVLGKQEFTPADIKLLKGNNNAKIKEAGVAIESLSKQGIKGVKDLEAEKKETDEYFSGPLDYGYNVEYNPRTIIGDNYDDLNNRFYGNNDVEGPDAKHGTHVAGIIAANRGNNTGIRGVADNVLIMSVRCVPDGDERDKDVANAIRYAVDNGASIINMSFGKGYSPNKQYVDEAIKYAAAHDVLLVHAAGNDAENNDTDPNFPNDKYAKSGLFKPKNAPNWLEVGALHWRQGDKRAADFSNYGKKNVDLFAPGVAIRSTVPNNGYEDLQGTSMAAPAAAGVAAILRSYYPDLSAKQVRNILIESAVKQEGDVYKPGTTEKVPFSELCVAGGVINSANAVAMADKTKAKKNKKAGWRSAAETARSKKSNPAIP